MKKIMIVFLMISISFIFCADEASARTRCYGTHLAPDNMVTFSFIFHPVSIGYKHRILGNWFLTGNMDYVKDESELVLQAGAAYVLPRKILFFRLYGGGGVEASRNFGTFYPYVMAGTKFWIFYTEIVHPMESNRTPTYRFGFSFSF